MTDRRRFGVLLALLVLLGAGSGAGAFGRHQCACLFRLRLARQPRRQRLRRAVSYLVTGFGVLWSIALLGESYSGYVWAALALMFAGLALVQPRPPVAALAGPGDDTDRRLSETP